MLSGTQQTQSEKQAQRPRSQVRMWQHVGQQLPTLIGLFSSSNNATLLTGEQRSNYSNSDISLHRECEHNFEEAK